MDGGPVTITMHTERPVWRFPFDPFVEYEEADEAWARPLGFGFEGTREEVVEVDAQFVALNWEPDPNSGEVVCRMEFEAQTKIEGNVAFWPRA